MPEGAKIRLQHTNDVEVHYNLQIFILSHEIFVLFLIVLLSIEVFVVVNENDDWVFGLKYDIIEFFYKMISFCFF